MTQIKSFYQLFVSLIQVYHLCFCSNSVTISSRVPSFLENTVLQCSLSRWRTPLKNSAISEEVFDLLQRLPCFAKNLFGFSNNNSGIIEWITSNKPSCFQAESPIERVVCTSPGRAHCPQSFNVQRFTNCIAFTGHHQNGLVLSWFLPIVNINFFHLSKRLHLVVQFIKVNKKRPHNVRALWCLRSESNQWHGDFQSPALPTELQRQVGIKIPSGNPDKKMERLTRLELATSTLARWRSTRWAKAAYKLCEAKTSHND